MRNIFITLAAILLLVGCEQESQQFSFTVVDSDIEALSDTSVTLNATINASDFGQIERLGFAVCRSGSETYDYYDTKITRLISITIDDLKPNTEYKCIVFAHTATDSWQRPIDSFTTLPAGSEPENPENPDNPENPEDPEGPENPDNPEEPEEPENPEEPIELEKPTLSATDITPTSFVVTWSVIDNADGYEVVTSAGAKTIYATEYKMENLVAGNYTVKVKALAGENAQYKDSQYATITQYIEGEKLEENPENTIADWLELPAVRDDDAYPNAVTVTVYDGSERNYTHYYDRSTYTSLWVAYPLESKHMGSLSRPGSWDWNPNISTSDQVDLRSRSYASGYSRGHLIPNASRNGIKNMQLQTFYVTNSVPQIQDNFNGGIWEKLETALQSIGKREKIYIVTGVAFNKVGESKSLKYAEAKDDNKSIPVPNYFYKVAMKVTTNSAGTVTDACTIGFWFEHKTYTDSYTNYTTTVDQIEAWTGFDFFANLPDSVESTVENNSSWSTFSSY